MYDLIEFFTKQYGEPVAPFEYTHPADLDPFGSAVCATWVDGQKIIMLYERSYNSVVYPQISLLTKSYFDVVVKNNSEVLKNMEEQTEEMFK